MGRTRTGGRFRKVNIGAVGGSEWCARRLGVIALFAAAWLGCASERTPWRSVKKTGAAFEAERRVFDHFNRERLVVGLRPLLWDFRDAATASGYSLEMLETKTIGGVPMSEGAADRVFVAKAKNLVALQNVALVHDLDEVHQGLMNSPDGRAILMSASATHVGIGISFGDEVSGRRYTFITVFVHMRPDADPVAAAETRAADDVPASPPLSSTSPPEQKAQKVSPTLLEGWRISGSPAIVPDDKTKIDIANVGVTKVIGTFRLCLASDGTIRGVDRLKTTRFPAYDAKIMREMRTWRYRPYKVDGEAVPVCTAVTFIYTQR